MNRSPITTCDIQHTLLSRFPEARRISNNEWIVRCHRRENHYRGDLNPSMTIEMEKRAWYCHTEKVGGKLSEILNIDALHSAFKSPNVSPIPRSLVSVDTHAVTTRQKEALLAEGRYFPTALKMLNARCVHLGSKSGIGLPTLKGNYAVLGIAHDGTVRRSEDGRIEKRHWPGGCGSSLIASPELFTGNYAEVIVLAGEWDLMAAIENGILNVATSTAGEGSIKPFLEHIDFPASFEEITILYDRDAAGERGARRLVATLHKALPPTETRKFRIVDLPEEVGPSGDARDFFQRCGHEGEDLALLIDRTSFVQPEELAMLESNGDLRHSSKPDSFPLTEVGNAERLIARHHGNLHFVSSTREWIVWDGKRFATDGRHEMEKLAKDAIRSIYEDATRIQDEGKRREQMKHAVRSETDRAIKAMISIAKAEHGVTLLAEELDADSWLLNVQNGTLDLRTGRLRPHGREDLITKLAPVAYDPKATCPLWTSFLKRVLPDPELRQFVQKLAGYTLTGDTADERFYFLYGPAASGKTSFTQALKSALGGYAIVADFEAFLKRTNVGSPRNDIARLVGARLVLSIEVDHGQHLAEALVKQLTGGDTISARLLHKEFFEFDPQFKLILAANHRPQVRDDDEAIWRRICVVPFAVSIPESERDPSIKQRLSDPAFAGAAILAWAVEGCLAWQKERLGTPPAIKEATGEYRAEVDRITGFLDEYCVFRSDAWTSAKSLREAYDSWCRENGVITPLNAREFAGRLKARGCIQGHRERARVWLGIGLQTDNE